MSIDRILIVLKYRYTLFILFFCFAHFIYAKESLLVGAYYFEGWSGQNSDPYMRSKNAPSHLNSKLLLKYDSRKPIWGWRDDDLSIMEKQIDLASENGIDFFSFCWYWQDNKSAFSESKTESLSINSGIELFMRAQNRHKMKFSIMIANHGGYEIVGKENYKKLIEYLEKKFFSDPQYLCIDNCPVLTFFNSSAVLPHLKLMNTTLQEIGYNGLFSISCNNNNNAFSSHCWYNIKKIPIPLLDKEYTYQELTEHVKSVWNKWYNNSEIAPLVMAGWDRRPWEQNENSTYYINRTPILFRNHFQDAIDYIRRNKPKSPIIMIYAWNEFGEGGYLVPTVGDPQGSYLRMIKEVRKKNRV